MRTVILANGDFPRKRSEARWILEHAKRVVCCDGAADVFRRRMGRECDFIVGDGDSVRGLAERMVFVAEQDTNDLAKAIRFCISRGWDDLMVLGATGKREDHALGNIFLTMEYGLPLLTDYGRFIPIQDSLRLKVGRGTAVSIFATPGTKMTSQGLKWPLKGVSFANFHCATLNCACDDIVQLKTTRPAYVYIA